MHKWFKISYSGTVLIQILVIINTFMPLGSQWLGSQW